MDERLAAYVSDQWPALVEEAATRGRTDDPDVAEQLAIAAVAKVGVRWWRVSDKDRPEVVVRRAMSAVSRDYLRRRPAASDYQVMEIGFSPASPALDGGDAATGPHLGLTPAEALLMIGRRVRRGRQNRALVGSVAVAVVVALAVTGIGSGGRPARAPTPASPQRHSTEVTLPQAPTDFATDVAAGGGYIWTIETRPTKQGAHSFVVERNPASGRVVDRYRVPQADDHIAYGFGKAWTWHDSNDFPTTTIATIDGVGDIDTERSTPSLAVHDVTFTSDFAWLTEPAANRVMTFRQGMLGAEAASSVAGARFVIPLSPTSVLVAGRTGTLRELPSQQFVYLGDRPPTLLAPAPDYGIWIAHGRRLTYQTAIDEPPTLTLSLSLDVASVIGDPAHGVYVATQSANPFHYDPYLVYYSPAALRSAHPQPTARLDGLVQAEAMVADPAGGVVFTTNDGAVDVWRPALRTVRVGQGRDHVDHAGITSSARRATPQGGFA